MNSNKKQIISCRDKEEKTVAHQECSTVTVLKKFQFSLANLAYFLKRLLFLLPSFFSLLSFLPSHSPTVGAIFHSFVKACTYKLLCNFLIFSTSLFHQHGVKMTARRPLSSCTFVLLKSFKYDSLSKGILLKSKISS